MAVTEIEVTVLVSSVVPELLVMAATGTEPSSVMVMLSVSVQPFALVTVTV